MFVVGHDSTDSKGLGQELSLSFQLSRVHSNVKLDSIYGRDSGDIKLLDVEDWLSLHVVKGKTLILEFLKSVLSLSDEGAVLYHLLDVLNGKISLKEVVRFVSAQNYEHWEFTVGDHPVAHSFFHVSAVDSSDTDVSQRILKSVSLVQLLNVGVLVVKSLIVLVQMSTLGDVAS